MERGACVWLAPSTLVDSGTFFTYIISRTGEKNKTGKVKRKGEEHIHVQKLAAMWEEECPSALGLRGAAHTGRKEGAFGESIGTGQNMSKDANDAGAEATLTLIGE